MPDSSELDRHEKLAEQAYSAIYDTPPLGRPKDAYDDACLHYHAAIAEALRLDLPDEVARLTKRVDHVRAVYNSQFRYV